MTIVTDYIERLNDKEKPVLSHLRELVYEIVPDTEDAFTYGVPTFRYKGKYLLAFASTKKFMSIYPGAEAIDVFKSQLTSFRTTKGTISFTSDHPLPDKLLRNIILFCRDAVDQKLTKR